jgi:opacity protein-like surface antigen
MRILRTIALVSAFALFVPHALQAQDHGSVSFVTGHGITQGSPISTLASAVSSGLGSNLNFGGRVAFTIAPGFEAVGEVGRIGNVLPPLVSSIAAFSPLDLRASATYTEGGMRALLGGHSAVSPYVEATGGFARLNLRVGGLSATVNDLLALGLAVTNRTSPMTGLGGGVVFHSGRLTMDAGYRYKKIFDKSFVTGLLGGGQSMTNHQVVFGAGVRF